MHIYWSVWLDFPNDFIVLYISFNLYYFLKSRLVIWTNKRHQCQLLHIHNIDFDSLIVLLFLMFSKYFWYFTLKYFILWNISCCCIRYVCFSLNGLFIAIASLLKLISLIFGCILILYLHFYCTDYVFYFTIISWTSNSNHV